MLVEQLPNEPPCETCRRCVEVFLNMSLTGTPFDVTLCTHCEISQAIHEEDSSKWNGYCRFLR